MSTLTRFRKQSAIQFINTMMELTNHTVTYANKLPKSVKFIWTVKLCGLCQDSLIDLHTVNVIYFTNREEYMRRKVLLENVLGRLDTLEAFLTCIALSPYYGYIDDKKNNVFEIEDGYPFRRWGELLDEERRLIKGLLNSDAKRVEQLPR